MNKRFVVAVLKAVVVEAVAFMVGCGGGAVVLRKSCGGMRGEGRRYVSVVVAD